MLATGDCTNHYTEQIVYESSWTDNTSNGISWFNLLTSESIPEETDITDVSHTPVQNNSSRSCSTSSIESCYVVLEIQRPRSVTEILTNVQKEQEVEEEEEMVEEMEELHFAQSNTDEHPVNYEQFTVSLTIEIPKEEYLVEQLQEQVCEVEEYAKVTQPIIQESPNEILFNKAKSLSRFTKRVKTNSRVSNKEQHLSTSSDDELLNTTTNITEQKLKNPICISNTSLDSIENRQPPPVSIPIRTTTTFSSLSTQRTSNPVQIQRPGPKMGTTTLTRTFAFDRACMEKYGQQKSEPIPVPIIPVTTTTVKKDIGLPPRQNRSTEINNSSISFSPSNNDIPLNQSRIVDDDQMTMNISMYDQSSSMLPMTSGSQSLSKTSSVLLLMKKCARTVTSEYRLANNNDTMLAEPKLLQVKYLDGRHPLKYDHDNDFPRKSQTLSSSISSRLNKLGLSKMSSTQDLSTGSTSLSNSYRKRVLNRFRNLIENNSNEPPPSRPWQHKTIIELFNDRKQKQ
ncbi:hypothetical protein I4U23_028564 [Adineta vaga]|nr:hypothetical protein I4U23_028564 [Adineta vaga]